MGLVLSIDCGTTNLKVGAVNHSGNIVSLRKSPVPVNSPEPGASEHDPEELFQLITALSKEVVRECKDEIEFVSISSYQWGLIFLDNSLRPLSGISLLSDTRAQRTFEQFCNEYKSLDLYRRTGCPLLCQYALPRLHYFRQKTPSLIENARWILSSKEYLIMRLTGEIAAEVSTSSATQMLNIKTLSWDEDILQKAGIESRKFPPIVDGLNTLMTVDPSFARATGIPATARVCVGAYDGASLCIGLGGLDTSIGVMNVGTSAMIRVPGKKPVFDCAESKRLQAYALTSEIFLNGGALNNSTLPIDWLNNRIMKFDANDRSLYAEGGSDSSIFTLPYLTGERDSKIGPYASGVIFGIKQHHTKKDLARSFMEGVAYSMKYIFEALEENKIEVNEIRVGGGGTRLTNWMQLFANILSVPLVIPQNQEVALVGNAIIAYTASGAYSDIKGAAAAMIERGPQIEPENERVSFYNERYPFFKKLRSTVGALYKEHADLF